MSSFNQYFKEVGAQTMVTRFFNKVDSFHKDRRITKIWHEVLEPEDHPASYYVENSKTATFTVKVMYQVNDEPEVLETEFEVPREIDGLFILEGSYRIASNRMSGDYDCRINMGAGEHYINFDYNRRYSITKESMRVKKQNTDLPLADREFNIKFSQLDRFLANPDKKELLKLTDRQSKKLQVKLDLPYKPEYITPQLIQECIAFGDDKVKDLIIDKTIESVPSSFYRFLFRGETGHSVRYIRARGQITNYFSRHGILPSPVNVITSMCNRFWKGSAEAKPAGRGEKDDLQSDQSVNAIGQQAQSDKISIPDTIAFNRTFADLIDIADTPINGNVNEINALTVSTHITNDGILFDVYTKDFKKITIEYLDYLNSKVVASEYVDYEKNELKPDQNGQVEVKYRMKRVMVPVEDIDLVDLHPDFRLSNTGRQIPFINYTDSVRVSMGTGMLKQAIPLANAERALVDTGNREELNHNVMNEKFIFPEGKVKQITEDKIVVALPGGKETEILRKTAIQSINDISVYTEPKVKVGQKIKKGDIVTGPVGLGNDTYKGGVNALVLYHAYFGKINEDALVISESFAKKIVSYSIIDLTFQVRSTSSLKWIIPVGSEVKSKDTVMTVNVAVRLDEINRQLSEKLGGIFDDSGLDRYVIEDKMKVPNSIDKAIVADVMIQKNEDPIIQKNVKVPDYTFSYTSDSYIEDYMKTVEDDRKKKIYPLFPEYVASDRLRPLQINPEEYKVVYTVRIRLIKYTYGMIGTKITSRYGGKGVVSEVMPDELMPYMIDSTTGEKKRIEVVMNPYSTINRKIPSVIMEQGLGNIAYALRNKVESMRKTKTGRDKILPMLEKYYPGRFAGLTTDEFLARHDNERIEEVYHFKVGSFSSFTPEKITEWMEELGVSSQSDIYMPEDQLTDWKEVEQALGSEETEKIRKTKAGKFRKVEKPLMAGHMTLLVLQHIPSYSNSVMTSMKDIRRRDEPILGRGKYRDEGLKVGEMELAVLLARNAQKFIKAAREDVETEMNQLFLNNLLGLGLTISDEKGYNQGGSSAKANVQKIKSKFRIRFK